MEPRLLHTRLIALLCGVVVATCAIIGVRFALPAQSQVDEGADYGYVYSGVKSASTAFAEAAMTDESLLVFGSSELSTPASTVPEVPAAVFGQNNYGLRLMLVGEAYDQSLWHAIALGAYANAQAGVPRGKAVLIVGPGWFVDGGMDGETFQTRFSYSLYAGLCANESVPDEVKSYVRSRLIELGVDETQVDSVSGGLPQDRLNAAVFGAIDDLKLRSGLGEVRDGGIPLADGPREVPDFKALREQALADGAAISTTNDWGVEDEFYTTRLEPVLDGAEGSRADETYSDTPEYDDLECFCDIADSCGIEVLLVVSPVMGPYYDYIGITADVREMCYERIRSVAAAHEGVQLDDFSDREYEKHFLYDIVHFGTVGWADLDEAIYGFAMEGR